jgi:hypothetical protein
MPVDVAIFKKNELITGMIFSIADFSVTDLKRVRFFHVRKRKIHSSIFGRDHANPFA